MQTIATSRKRVYNRTYFSDSRRHEAVSSLLLQVQVQDNRLTNHRTNKFVVLAFESSGWTDLAVQKLVNVWEALRRLGPDPTGVVGAGKFTHNTTTRVQLYFTTEGWPPMFKYGDFETPNDPRMRETKFQYLISLDSISNILELAFGNFWACLVSKYPYFWIMGSRPLVVESGGCSLSCCM